MKTELYFFSGTGNSYYIAKKIGEAFTDSTLTPINTLDLSKDIETQAQIVGIIFPVYCLDAPALVKKFIKKLIVTNSSYVFLYANFGAHGGNALSNCASILTDKNIKVSNTFSLVLPDNSITFPTKEADIKPMLAAAEGQIEAHITDIKALKPNLTPNNKPGVNFLSNMMLRLTKSYLGFNDLKADTAKCNGCGLCTKVCPMKNIALDNSVPFFKDKCEMCFACIHYCPNECIRFKKMKPKNNFQYTNPNISVREIIEKNI